MTFSLRGRTPLVLRPMTSLVGNRPLRGEGRPFCAGDDGFARETTAALVQPAAFAGNRPPSLVGGPRSSVALPLLDGIGRVPSAFRHFSRKDDRFVVEEAVLPEKDGRVRVEDGIFAGKRPPSDWTSTFSSENLPPLSRPRRATRCRRTFPPRNAGRLEKKAGCIAKSAGCREKTSGCFETSSDSRRKTKDHLGRRPSFSRTRPTVSRRCSFARRTRSFARRRTPDARRRTQPSRRRRPVPRRSGRRSRCGRRFFAEAAASRSLPPIKTTNPEIR